MGEDKKAPEMMERFGIGESECGHFGIWVNDLMLSRNSENWSFTPIEMLKYWPSARLRSVGECWTTPRRVEPTPRRKSRVWDYEMVGLENQNEYIVEIPIHY